MNEDIHPKGCGIADCLDCLICDNPYANPHCEICHGAGFVHPRDPFGQTDNRKIIPCPAVRCLQEHVMGAVGSGLGVITGVATLQKFENFKTRVKFPTVNHALQTSLQFAQYWGEGKEPKSAPFLLLQGGVGVGKTHLCNAAGIHIAKCGHQVRVWNVGELIGDLQKSIKDSAVNERLKEIKEIYCLIMDDYKGEYSAIYPWGVEKIEEIIDHRYRTQVPTMMTTNNDIEQMPARVSDRFLDRTLSTIIQIDAKSYRPLKKGEINVNR